MHTPLEEFLIMVKNKKQSQSVGTLNKTGQELAADIVKEVKTLGPDQGELRKQLNRERIKALGLTLIQGGKV